MMKYRCYNPKYSSFKEYGGRGVTVCDEWLSDPMNFIRWALNNGYDDTLSIDRIDVNGNYDPNNCRWATSTAQQRNKRKAFLIVFDGVERSFADVCDENGVSRRNAWQHWMRHKDKTKLVEYIKSHALSAS